MNVVLIRLFLCLVLFLIAGYSLSYADDWEYGKGFAEELLFLHAMINYDFHPDWQRGWERDQMNAAGVRASFGSISKSQLLHAEDIVLNTSLGCGWYFRTHLTWFGSRHEDIDRSSQFIEFQKTITGPLAFTAAGDVRHEKDEIDGAAGLLITSPSRTEYAALRFIWDDLCYDERNRDGGRSNREATGIGWLARWEHERWTVYTEGRYTGGFSRNFTDIDRSPDLAHHNRQVNLARLKAVYDFGKNMFIEAEISHMHFDEEKRFRSPGSDYSYLHEIHHGLVRWMAPVRPFRQLRFELHGVSEHARASGYRPLSYDRLDIMPAVFLRFGYETCPFEVGYFSSVYEWDYKRIWEGKSDNTTGYADKAQIDWSIVISENASILFSLSHVIEWKRFGGGNIQLQVFQ